MSESRVPRARLVKPRWHKVLADLWGNKTRSMLVIASIAVGVFAIGLIVGTLVMLKSDLRTSYVSSNPANIRMATAPLTDDAVDVIRRVPGVAEAEGYAKTSVQLRVAQQSPNTLNLYAFPDFDQRLIHRLLLPVGKTVPADHEIILEHKTLADIGASIGDTITVEAADGTRRQLTIVGTGVDQSDVEDIILGDYRGYVSFETLKWLHQPTPMTRLYVTVSDQPNDRPHIQQIATAVTDRLERAGLSVYSTDLALRDVHPLASILEALVAVLLILGVLTVFLSGSLIANTMSALLTQHLRQIGIMKLVGARRFQVIAMYVVMIMSFGLAALAFAIPLGSVAAYGLLRFVSSIVNFVPQDFRIVPLSIVIQLAIGLAIPPVAGIVPVLKGSGITVQEAISSTGISGDPDAHGWIDRLLERLRMLPRPLLISLRNTFRRKGRLALTLLTLTLGGAIFIAVFNSRVALSGTMAEVSRYFGADVELEFPQDYRIARVVSEAQTVEGVESVEVWTTTSAEWQHEDGSPSSTIGVIAPPADTALVDPTLLAGRWLVPGDQNAVTINEAFWDEYPDIKPGDTLRLKLAGREQDWTIVGIFKYTGLDQLVAYANRDYVAGLLKATQHASSYRIVTTEHTLAYQKAVADRLNVRFRDLGFEGVTTQAGKAINASVTDMLGLLTAVMLMMAVMTAIVGSIGLTGTMSMNVMERTREIGVMRAIGAHDRIIARLVIVEGLVIGLISYLVGGILSFPISGLLSSVISLAIFNAPAPFVFTAQGFAIWLGVVALLSVAASVLPARNASRLTIREVLAYE